MNCKAREYEGRKYFTLGVIVNDEIGFINSNTAYKAGEHVKLGLVANRDHKLVAAVVNNG